MPTRSFSPDSSIGFFDSTVTAIFAPPSSSTASSGISSPGSGSDCAASAFSEAASVSRSSSNESVFSLPSFSKARSSFWPAESCSAVPQAAEPARTAPTTAVAVRVLRMALMMVSS
ncbi:hypothetical protein ABZ023_25610 [Streptomyces sp. NPDC006367]|uniref:hypothetical protein n=1 Tax=unclassified Streptomyces TaxID=2593676 RepID=UPI0033B80D65